ncbi:DUF58 domain-containing protein [Coraliomargarita sp. SDUM461003]|uniref:DUF58 domain-containing protein n=1 Tax=Thalassobacterium maritimum TaxID=3041265 RepID=A0ABU1AZE2_9BACT|nr:DUF58 domain-containing protein [Coraliomargarita sp. SDUM461003]MDQ8209521.1 DUF58 domain-containing protein [Coraliomargarita sp. SDUM461003]
MLDELDQRLNLLELKCRRPVEHLLAGEYRSIFRGRGIEFEDVRPYQPGDDVRTMDWKVTARTGTPHIKRYVEEREQFFYLLVDVSASMRHGSHSDKSKTVSEICALLTMAAIKNQDRVGLILFSDEIEQIVPAAKGRSHAMRIMDELINFQPKGSGTNFTEALGRFVHIASKRSVVFVVSDFFTENYTQELQNLACRHDVNAIHIAQKPFDPAAGLSLVRMQDAESGQQRIVDLKAQPQAGVEHHLQLKREMLESGVNLLSLQVGADCVQALAGFFQQRQRQSADATGG